MVVIARTDARVAVGGSVDEVLRRCEAYLKAGVDMLMVVALQNREETRRVMEAFPGTPIYINASAIRPGLAHAEYAEMGVATYSISVAKVITRYQPTGRLVGFDEGCAARRNPTEQRKITVPKVAATLRTRVNPLIP